MKSSTASNHKNNIKDNDILQHKLQNFTVRHTSHHIPLALVTSGGTSAPLEHNCVRYLDNFSTGTRGAYAVEEFLKRGYAVIHLKREGSVAPFGRILNNVLKCGRDGLNFESLGSLFDCTDGDSNNDDTILDFGLQGIDEEDDDTYEEKKNTTSSDPWMYSSSNSNEQTNQYPKQQTKSRRSNERGEVSINPKLAQSSILQSTLRQYKHIKQQGMLITINFQTVDDYLHKLQLCSEAINMGGSLGLVYLAAAVSDFYIPQEKRALHKIQSRDYGIKSQASSSIESSSSGDENGNTGDNNNIENTMQIQEDNTLTLKLYPVPKVIPTLRKEWCPNAFAVSFKLETDSTILQQKAVLAMKRNNVHMIVGNELSTRYEKVFILSHKIDGFDNDAFGRGEDKADLPEGYHIAKVTADNVDELESATIEYVVRRHFHYISTNINDSDGTTTMPNLMSASEMTACHVLRAKSIHDERIVNTYRQLQYESLKSRVGEIAWNVFGSALGMCISYGIGRMIQSRQH